VYPRASELALDRDRNGYTAYVVDATSLLRITVVRFAGRCSDLRPLWWTKVLPRARGTNVLVVDLHQADFDDLSVVPDIIRSCRNELPGSELRVMFDTPLDKPGSLHNVIWEEIDLEPARLAGQNDQFSGLRLAGQFDDADSIGSSSAVKR
jgi:hypothetical protein